MKLLPWDYGIRNLSRSKVRTVLCVSSGALIALLAIAASGVVHGLERSLKADVSPNVGVVYGAGSEDSLERSDIDARTPSLIAASVPGIKRLNDELEFISPEVIMAIAVELESQSEQRLAIARGITESAYLLHKNVQIVEGRAPRPAYNELMIGQLAPVKMGVSVEELAIGKTLLFDNTTWTIVGHFVAPGSVLASEIWLPLTDLMVATKREGISAVLVEMDPSEGGDLADLETFAFHRLDLELIAMPISEYYKRVDAFYKPIKLIVWLTAILVALGALFGGINTMYAAFAGRIREFGMLRCVGWRPSAIGLSLMQESVVSVTAGALLGCLVGIVFLDGLEVRFTMGAFELLVGPIQIMIAMVAAFCVAVFGVLPPAIRCLKSPLNESLKSI